MVLVLCGLHHENVGSIIQEELKWEGVVNCVVHWRPERAANLDNGH